MDLNRIQPGMAVIGADDYPVGTVAGVEGRRIKLAPVEGGRHIGHNHFLDIGLVADIEGDKVRLSAKGDVAFSLEEERSGDPTDR